MRWAAIYITPLLLAFAGCVAPTSDPPSEPAEPAADLAPLRVEFQRMADAVTFRGKVFNESAPLGPAVAHWQDSGRMHVERLELEPGLYVVRAEAWNDEGSVAAWANVTVDGNGGDLTWYVWDVEHVELEAEGVEATEPRVERTT